MNWGGQMRRFSFLLCILVITPASAAPATNVSDLQQCVGSQRLAAAGIWASINSNDEASRFVRQQYEARGSEGFIQWLACQGFEVKTETEGNERDIRATYYARDDSERLWGHRGWFDWVWKPGSYYIVMTIRNGVLTAADAAAIYE